MEDDGVPPPAPPRARLYLVIVNAASHAHALLARTSARRCTIATPPPSHPASEPARAVARRPCRPCPYAALSNPNPNPKLGFACAYRYLQASRSRSPSRVQTGQREMGLSSTRDKRHLTVVHLSSCRRRTLLRQCTLSSPSLHRLLIPCHRWSCPERRRHLA